MNICNYLRNVFFILNATTNPAVEGQLSLTFIINHTTQKTHSIGTNKDNYKTAVNLRRWRFSVKTALQ